MRTTEERVRLIRERTAEKRHAAQKRRRFAQCAGCVAACLLLIAGLGARMGGLTLSENAIGSGETPGAASLIGQSNALCCIVMGILAFGLGVCVTVLLYRLGGRRKRPRREDRRDEL